MRSSLTIHSKLWSDARHNPSTDRRRVARATFVKDKASQEPAKIIARKTGLSETAVYNIRYGRNDISFGALNNWLDNDPAFAEEFIALIRTDPYSASGAERPAVYQPATWTAEERGDECEQQAAMMREMTGRRE